MPGSLFIGIAIAPSITATEVVTDRKSVEFTVEICGVGNGEEHMVQLTREQSNELDTLFNSIKARLDEAETLDKTVEIYTDAILELDRYDVLDGLSFNQAQKLVLGPYQYPKIMDLFHRN